MIGGESTENNLGLDGILDDDDFEQVDVSDFQPRPKRNIGKPHKKEIRGATLEVGFQDRGGAVATSGASRTPRPRAR